MTDSLNAETRNINIILCTNHNRAVKYCKKHNLEIENTEIRMFFDYYESFLNNRAKGTQIFHDLDNKRTFEINNYGAISNA